MMPGKSSISLSMLREQELQWRPLSLSVTVVPDGLGLNMLNINNHFQLNPRGYKGLITPGVVSH